MRAILFWILMLLTLPALAAVTLTREGSKFVLENELVRLRVDPTRGGMVDSYCVKATGRELLVDGATMLIDHFWQQRWPGEFMNAPYEAVVITDTPETATLEVSRVSKGEGNNTTQAGIRIRRRLTLRAGSPQLLVEVAMENIAPAGKMAGYWFQCQLYANGLKDERQWYYTPTIRGVSSSYYEPIGDKLFVDENCSADGFTRNPQQGWLATLGGTSHNGLACVMPYDELMFLYTCYQASTLEWQYKSAAIPSGKAWKTAFVLYPLVNLPRVDYASRQLVAAVESADVDGKVTAKVTLASTEGTLRNVTVSGDAMQPRKTGHPATAFAPQQLASLGGDPVAVTLTAPHDPAEPVVLRITVSGTRDGKAISETFLSWFGGRYGKNWQVDTSPLYVFPSPERHVSFLKPDVITKTINPTPKTLVCHGLFVNDFLPESALTAVKAQATPSYFSPSSTFPASLSYFPASYEDLMGFDIIALINIDAVALGDAGLEMVKDFVQHGGTLIYGGDLYAYAHNGVTGTQLGDLLPVTFRDGKDAPAPRYLKPQPVLVDGTPLTKGAVMLYANNDFAVKPGARVRATCQGQPVVVDWHVGKGRVIALTGTSLGIVPKGKTLYLRTPEWSNLLVKVLGEK